MGCKHLRFCRTWAMPNSKTFNIKPIRKLMEEHGFYFDNKEVFLDPFPLPYKQDAISFLKQYSDETIGKLTYDPPYSLRQLKEVYNNQGLALTQEYTQSYWNLVEDQIDRILKPGGICIKFGWNTKRISKNFEIIRIMLVSHGGNHNDTIVTVQKKDMQSTLDNNK